MSRERNASRRHRRLLLVLAIVLSPLVGRPAIPTSAQYFHGTAAVAADGRILSASPDPAMLSTQPITEDPSWQSYIITDNAGLVYPVSVTVQGDATQVTNPSGLVGSSGGGTTIRATGAGQPALLLDLGINTGGKVEVGISQGDGTPVLLAYSEAQRYMTPHGDTTDGAAGHDDSPDGRTDTITTTAGAVQFTSPGIRGGERWILVQLQGAGTVTISYVRVRVTHYDPAPTDYAGHFLSNDDLVNRAWYAGAYTFSMDAARDTRPGQGGNLVSMDGAKRDRLVWTGDLAVAGLTGLYVFDGAPQIIHDSITMFACRQQADGYIPPNSQINVVCPAPYAGPLLPVNHPFTSGEYIAWYIVDAYLYYLYTGDQATLSALMPVLRLALGYLNTNAAAAPGGLYDTPPGDFGWHFIDESAGESANTNAVYYRALLAMTSLEQSVGNTPAAAADQLRAAQVGQALMNLLWDGAAGAFRLNTCDQHVNHPQDANVQAVVAGLLSGPQAASALAYLQQHLSSSQGTLTGELTNDPYMFQTISPYVSSWELWARFMEYDATTALDLLRREFGYMVSTDPNVTFWEAMLPPGEAYPAQYFPTNVVDGPGQGSLSHAWSTGPTSALPAYVLGIRPTAPGYAGWIVEPQPADLQWAQGQAPTPRGAIVSRWERGASDSFIHMTVQGPGTVSGTVGVPLLGADRTIYEDGAAIWQNGRPAPGVQAQRQGDYVEVTGVSGAHTFAWVTATPTPVASSTPPATAAATGTPVGMPTSAVGATQTPGGAAVTSSVSSAVPMQSITVSGTNYTPGEPIKLFWDCAGPTPLTTTTADAAGNVAARVSVPQSISDTHAVVVAGQTSGLTASSSLHVTSATFMGRSYGPQGSQQVINGVGFWPYKPVSATWQSGNLPLGASNTNLVGTFVGPEAITFTVPLRPTGLYSITVSGLNATASSPFYVIPALYTTPSKGAHGSSATVLGTGYSAYDTVTVRWDCAAAGCGGPALGTGVTNANGDVAFMVTVPATATVGTYTLGGVGSRGAFASTRYTVTQ